MKKEKEKANKPTMLVLDTTKEKKDKLQNLEDFLIQNDVQFQFNSDTQCYEANVSIKSITQLSPQQIDKLHKMDNKREIYNINVSFEEDVEEVEQFRTEKQQKQAPQSSKLRQKEAEKSETQSLRIENIGKDELQKLMEMMKSKHNKVENPLGQSVPNQQNAEAEDLVNRLFNSVQPQSNYKKNLEQQNEANILDKLLNSSSQNQLDQSLNIENRSSKGLKSSKVLDQSLRDINNSSISSIGNSKTDLNQSQTKMGRSTVQSQEQINQEGSNNEDSHQDRFSSTSFSKTNKSKPTNEILSQSQLVVSAEIIKNQMNSSSVSMKKSNIGSSSSFIDEQDFDQKSDTAAMQNSQYQNVNTSNSREKVNTSVTDMTSSTFQKEGRNQAQLTSSLKQQLIQDSQTPQKFSNSYGYLSTGEQTPPINLMNSRDLTPTQEERGLFNYNNSNNRSGNPNNYQQSPYRNITPDTNNSVYNQDVYVDSKNFQNMIEKSIRNLKDEENFVEKKDEDEDLLPKFRYVNSITPEQKQKRSLSNNIFENETNRDMRHYYFSKHNENYQDHENQFLHSQMRYQCKESQFNTYESPRFQHIKSFLGKDQLFLNNFPTERDKERVIILQKTLDTIAEIEKKRLILPHQLPSHQLILYYDYLQLKAQKLEVKTLKERKPSSFSSQSSNQIHFQAYKN